MTKQEISQNYFQLADEELVAFINSNIFEPIELNGIFSYYTYNNKTAITEAFLA